MRRTPYHGGRLIVDVSSLVRWTGPPVGIARVERALASQARLRPDAVLSVFDRTRGTFREISPDWLQTLIGFDGMLDDQPPRHGWRRWLPTRGPAVRLLERWRLTLPSPAAWLADAAQRALLALRQHGTPVHGATARVARVPPDLALGADLRLGPADILFTAGSGWAHLDPIALARLKHAHGFRYATLCYDLIPLTHEQFWRPEDVVRVRAHWLAHLPLADLVVVNSHCVAADVRRLCDENGIAPPRLTVLPLGFDPPGASPAAPPAGLEPGRYALFVSTIEPRKGHAVLLQAWRALLERGIPQRHRFRLVFIGRAGWMVDSVLAGLADPALEGSVVHLTGIDEDALDAAYRHAAFCLYPSITEGFGLPLIEAFARGIPVIASTGGALPETAGGLAPCVRAHDAAAWEAVMAEWIEHKSVRETWAARVREGFAHPGWPAAATRILDAVQSAQAAPGAEQP